MIRAAPLNGKEPLMNELKNNILIEREPSKEKENFLDFHLMHYYFEYIPKLWEQGFRPSSQEAFRQSFFSFPNQLKYTSYSGCPTESQLVKFIPKASRTFRSFLGEYKDSDLLAFPDPSQLIVLILNNPAIDLELTQKLLERHSDHLNARQMMSCIKQSVLYKETWSPLSDEHLIRLIEKVTYLLSLLKEPINIMLA
ncbi:MAG: hypothetical protein ACRCXC_08465 [Legionella sp.]